MVIGGGNWTEVDGAVLAAGSFSADLSTLSVFAVVDKQDKRGACAAAPGVPLGMSFSDVAGDLMALALAMMLLLGVRSRKRAPRAPATVGARRT